MRALSCVSGILSLGLLMLGFAGCNAPPTPLSQSLPTPKLEVEKLTEGFTFAVKMAFLPDGRLLVTEKETGYVRLVNADFSLQSEPIVDVAVNYLKERGLMGIAVHPAFLQNGYVYIYYMASSTGQDSNLRDEIDDIRIARFQLPTHARPSGTANTVTGTLNPPDTVNTVTGTLSPPDTVNAATGTLKTLISLTARPGPYHNGGCIHFGPDGKLYVSQGELNRNVNLISQIKRSTRGKLLRYNDDGSIPADNPLGATQPAYLLGLRNAFGFAFDPFGAGIFISDNGPDGNDKLSLALPGENLGWPLIWGYADAWYERPMAWLLGQRYRAPLWESFEQRPVPTAVQVLPDDRYGPAMAGRVLMSLFSEGRIVQFALDSDTRSTAVGMGVFLEGYPTIVDLQFGPDGYLYVLTIQALYRMKPVET
ncbi:PQQ-dependent sugar dehydrogenase [Candidatus Entotheonella palauensis]|nr:PQQ-dependent sugar dehydrogenase [Candidatus Entotheonella palauensis]